MGRHPSKYRNVKTQVDGIMFASKREADRYGGLKFLQKAGQIWSLECHPRWPLRCGGTPIKIRNKNNVARQVFYVADFSYRMRSDNELIVEDVKGFDTPISRLKRGIMEADHGIKVRIIK